MLKKIRPNAYIITKLLARKFYLIFLTIMRKETGLARTDVRCVHNYSLNHSRTTLHLVRPT